MAALYPTDFQFVDVYVLFYIFWRFAPIRCTVLHILLNLYNPLNTDTTLIRTLPMVPSVSVLKGFDCIKIITYTYIPFCWQFSPVFSLGQRQKYFVPKGRHSFPSVQFGSHFSPKTRENSALVSFWTQSLTVLFKNVLLKSYPGT